MANFILAGLFTEGTTDVRFLESIVKKTLVDVAFECSGEIETELEIININKTGLNFNQQVLEASKKASIDFSVLILFVHTDADGVNGEIIFQSKIIPAKEFLNIYEDNSICKNVVAIVPIQMTESWMLADKELLKSEIGIAGTDFELGIHKNPEEITNPKAAIEKVIQLSKENQTKRKRNKGLMISDLYQIIGQKVELSELEKLPSYLKFKSSLREMFIELNFLHD